MNGASGSFTGQWKFHWLIRASKIQSFTPVPAIHQRTKPAKQIRYTTSVLNVYDTPDGMTIYIILILYGMTISY